MTITRILAGVLAAAALAAPLASARAQAPSAGAQAQSKAQVQQSVQNALTQAQTIAPVFSGPAAWRGQIPAGALGPASTPTTSQGTANCSPILQGQWYSCDVTDRVGTGADQTNWQGHMIVGYDAATSGYKATMVDNQGTQLTTMDGTLTGKKLTLTTPAPITLAGQQLKQRLSFDYTDPNNIQFTDERQQAGQQGWTVYEKATIKPVAGVSRQASTPSRRGN